MNDILLEETQINMGMVDEVRAKLMLLKQNLKDLDPEEAEEKVKVLQVELNRYLQRHDELIQCHLESFADE